MTAVSDEKSTSDKDESELAIEVMLIQKEERARKAREHELFSMLNSEIEGYGKPGICCEKAECFYCKEKCDPFAGNPSKWPIKLPVDPEKPGKPISLHVGCVMIRLKKLEEIERLIDKQWKM